MLRHCIVCTLYSRAVCNLLEYRLHRFWVSWEISVGCNKFALMIVVLNLYRSKVIQTYTSYYTRNVFDSYLFNHRGCQIIKLDSFQFIFWKQTCIQNLNSFHCSTSLSCFKRSNMSKYHVVLKSTEITKFAYTNLLTVLRCIDVKWELRGAEFLLIFRFCIWIINDFNIMYLK